MLKLASDENFHDRIVRGLVRALPDVDIVRVQDVGLSQADNATILAWAAREGRVLLTHDRTTVPPIAYERIDAGYPCLVSSLSVTSFALETLSACC